MAETKAPMSTGKIREMAAKLVEFADSMDRMGLSEEAYVLLEDGGDHYYAPLLAVGFARDEMNPYFYIHGKPQECETGH